MPYGITRPQWVNSIQSPNQDGCNTEDKDNHFDILSVSPQLLGDLNEILDK